MMNIPSAALQLCSLIYLGLISCHKGINNGMRCKHLNNKLGHCYLATIISKRRPVMEFSIEKKITFLFNINENSVGQVFNLLRVH